MVQYNVNYTTIFNYVFILRPLLILMKYYNYKKKDLLATTWIKCSNYKNVKYLFSELSRYKKRVYLFFHKYSNISNTISYKYILELNYNN